MGKSCPDYLVCLSRFFSGKCLVQTEYRFESGFSLDKIYFYFSEMSRSYPDLNLVQKIIWIQSGQFCKIKTNFVQTESRLESGFCLDLLRLTWILSGLHRDENKDGDNDKDGDEDKALEF